MVATRRKRYRDSSKDISDEKRRKIEKIDGKIREGREDKVIYFKNLLS